MLLIRIEKQGDRKDKNPLSVSDKNIILVNRWSTVLLRCEITR